MPQAQLKHSYILVTLSCSHCQQEQIVQMQARAGFLSLAHQSVKCLKCEQYFDLMIPDVIIGGPFLRTTNQEFESL